MWGLWHCLGGYVSRGDMQSQELSGGEKLSKIVWDPPRLHGEARGDEITIGGRLGGVKITTIWSRGRRAKQRRHAAVSRIF